MASEESTGVERRSFLRTAALGGLATAWAVPIVQTVAIPSALARGDQSPAPSESDSESESDDRSDGD